MVKESTQKKVGRVRPPRVQLEFDVETDGAIRKKEIPFVVGVVGDFSAQSKKDKGRPQDRKFVGVDSESIDKVMDSMKPRVSFQVKNKLSREGGKIGADLTFTSMEDFKPEKLVNQIDPLRELVEIRTQLAELRNKIAGSDKLDTLLSDALNNPDKRKQLETSVQPKETDHE